MTAGYTLDGAGDLEFGPWAALWGAVAAATGAAIGLLLERATRGVGEAAAAGVCLVVSVCTWGWIHAWRVPVTTLEGAWMCPVAAVATVAAALPARSSRQHQQ